MKGAPLFAALLLAACAREPVEKPLVDLSTLGHPMAPKPKAALDARSPFQRLYAAPATATEQPAWLERLREARERDRRALAAEGVESVYEDPALAWARSSYVETPLLVHDRYFYDPGVRRFTVDRYLDDLVARWGGPDTVALQWAYPNLGIDERNQFDLLADLPGGLASLRRVVDLLHERKVRVLLTYHPWDGGTRPGKADAQTVARLLKETGADGLAGDTMVAPERELFLAAKRAGVSAAIEP